jgi:hypothetical protein
MQNTNKYTFFYFNGCNIGNANDADPQGSGNIYGKDFIVIIMETPRIMILTNIIIERNN